MERKEALTLSLVIIQSIIIIILLIVIMLMYKFKISKDYLIGSWLDMHGNIYIIDDKSLIINMEESGKQYDQDIIINRCWTSNNCFKLISKKLIYECYCYPNSGHMDLYRNNLLVGLLSKNTIGVAKKLN